jgi:SAM-dependent methyltransferase
MLLNPLPSKQDISHFYEQEFFSKDGVLGYADYETEQKWRGKNYRRDAAVLENLMPGGRILDVGCATGHFLDALSDKWDKYGLEVSEYAGRQACKRYGNRIQISPIQQANYPSDFFDAATLWETINHMADPMGDLTRIHQILRKDGIMAISVGDCKSLLARLMGKYWYHVTPPIHIYYFTPNTLKHLFRQAGFEIVKLHYPGKFIDLAGCLERIKDTTSAAWLVNGCRKLASYSWTHFMLYVNLRDTMYVYAKKK